MISIVVNVSIDRTGLVGVMDGSRIVRVGRKEFDVDFLHVRAVCVLVVGEEPKAYSRDLWYITTIIEYACIG